MDEIKNTAVKKRKKKRSTNPAVRVLKILGTALLSIFLILIITCSIFATVLTIYVLNFADTTTTISLDKTETSNISRFLSVNPDYDEDDEDSQEYDLYYALKTAISTLYGLILRISLSMFRTLLCTPRTRDFILMTALTSRERSLHLSMYSFRYTAADR